MLDNIPQKWILNPLTNKFEGIADKNEYYVFQVGLWAKENTDVKLTIDFNRAGLNSDRIKITAPAIKNFQAGREFKLNEPIPIEPTKGWLLIIEAQ